MLNFNLEWQEQYFTKERSLLKGVKNIYIYYGIIDLRDLNFIYPAITNKHNHQLKTRYILL